MQILIWQGFSSNHSSRFTVVGVFQSPDHAQQASEVLLSLLHSIEDWYNLPENTAVREEWQQNGNLEPSPPERAIAEQLGIPWSPLSLDWLWFDAEGHGPVKVVDSLVFVAGTESSLGAHPADYLIQRVGGQALVDGYIGGEGGETASLVLSLTCRAPDEAAAEAIEGETSAYLRDTDQHGLTSHRTPWMTDPGLMGYSTLRGKVRRARRALIFTGEFFHIADGFPAMLAYLRARECTDIHYEFTEKRDPDE